MGSHANPHSTGEMPVRQSSQTPTGGEWVHTYTERSEQLPDGNYKRTIHHEYIGPGDIVLDGPGQDLVAHFNGMPLFRETNTFERLKGRGWERKVVTEHLLKDKGGAEHAQLGDGSMSSVLATSASTTSTQQSSASQVSGQDIFRFPSSLSDQLDAYRRSLSPSVQRSSGIGSTGSNHQGGGLFASVASNKTQSGVPDGRIQNDSSSGLRSSVFASTGGNHQGGGLFAGRAASDKAQIGVREGTFQNSSPSAFLSNQVPQSSPYSASQQVSTEVQKPSEPKYVPPAVGTLFPPYHAFYSNGELFDAITTQPHYRDYSVEELRVADYDRGRRDASQPWPLFVVPPLCPKSPDNPAATSKSSLGEPSVPKVSTPGSGVKGSLFGPDGPASSTATTPNKNTSTLADNSDIFHFEYVDSKNTQAATSKPRSNYAKPSVCDDVDTDMDSGTAATTATTATPKTMPDEASQDRPTERPRKKPFQGQPHSSGKPPGKASQKKK